MRSPPSLFPRFAGVIAGLPAGVPLTREHLLVDGLLLAREDAVRVYYAPVDYVNRRARVAVVGITPGWQQMARAFEVARAHVGAASPREVCRRAVAAAGFAGSLRRPLVRMLDGIGVADALGLATAAELFDRARAALHVTSAVRYPVFVRGTNYTGHAPALLESAVLRDYVVRVLARELAAIPDALVVPLGRAVSEALGELAASDQVDGRRCLVGFPHPSGANGHRDAQYAAARRRLRRQVRAWIG